MSVKLTQVQYLERFHEYGKDEFFEILEGYKNAGTPMLFRHKECGTEFRAKPWSILRTTGNTGCRACSIKDRNSQKVKPFEYFLSHIPERYLDEFEFSGYTRINAPITAKCKRCGKVKTYSSAKSFMSGDAGCRSCSARKPISDIEADCKKFGFTYVSHEDCHNIVMRCDKCGKESVRTGSNLLKGCSCRYCSAQNSAGEDEVAEYVESIYGGEIVRRTRAILPSKHEIDIYIPDRKVAIEYNGTYWHSSAEKPDRHYHLDKTLECESLGIRLIQVWEHEWANQRQREVLKNIIASALHCIDSDKRLYARSLVITKIKIGDSRWGEASDFFATNNIQGNRGGSVVYALCDNSGEIIMAYKFGRPSGGRAKSKYEWEMVRGATKIGYQVIGGATKLWKHFIRDYSPSSVVYYIDLNYFNGQSPKSIGMEYVGCSYGVKNYFKRTGEVKNRCPAKHKEISELVKSGEVIPIYTSGVATYVYRV